MLVTIPPHTGAATLMFDLHNRHTYSEEDIRAGQGFAKYTAIVAVLSMKGDLLGRGAVQTEFRTAQDLYDRVSGGAGPGGVKAVAPLGKESINVTVPAGTDVVSILGEVLDATTAAGHETATPGRTVAISATSGSSTGPRRRRTLRRRTPSGRIFERRVDHLPPEGGSYDRTPNPEPRIPNPEPRIPSPESRIPILIPPLPP